MSKNKIILTIGAILILLIPAGFPSRFEWTIVFLCGATLIFLSVSSSIERRIAGMNHQKKPVEKKVENPVNEEISV